MTVTLTVRGCDHKSDDDFLHIVSLHLGSDGRLIDLQVKVTASVRVRGSIDQR